MSDENVNAIRALYDAYRRKDVDAILDIFHPDIEIFQSEQLPWGLLHRLELRDRCREP